MLNITNMMKWGLALCLYMLMATFSAQAVNITGAGASTPYPIYAKWAGMYYQATGKQVNYQSIGSGGGQQQAIARTVDFGASDDPMSYADLQVNQLIQFPAVVGGTVPVVNIKGIEAGDLKLSGGVLADIYLGKITRWDDPAIQRLNPSLSLPSSSIVVVHRSDGAGTTFLWTNYLSKVSADWKEQVGEGKAVKWPTGQGGKGNEGVAAYVRQLNNSIGYVEYAYVLQNHLAWAQLQNKDGHFVAPTQASFAAVVEEIDWENTPGMAAILTNQAGKQAWPVVAASFILVNKEQRRPQRAQAVFEFFDWVFKHGAQAAIDFNYVPLPSSVTQPIQQLWADEVKAKDGSTIWKSYESQ